ncbi:hypothetical protein EON76_06100 [bacterium]|nr:MAG: hypothetical protein EON76_06100 [bacterium]
MTYIDHILKSPKTLLTQLLILTIAVPLSIVIFVTLNDGPFATAALLLGDSGSRPRLMQLSIIPFLIGFVILVLALLVSHYAPKAYTTGYIVALIIVASLNFGWPVAANKLADFLYSTITHKVLMNEQKQQDARLE